MKQLIVNADDFGFTRGVNSGIVRAFEAGIVTSTTIMANGEAFENAVELARACPGLGVGCHLAIVGGQPVASAVEVPSLVDERGALPPTLTKLVIKLATGSVRSDDIEREFRAQVTRVINAGITPTHLDSHKHSHTHPTVMKALGRMAAEFNIPCVRNPFEAMFTARRTRGGSRAKTLAYLKQYVLSAATAPGAVRFRQIVREYGLRTPDFFFGVKLTGMLDTGSIRSIMKDLPDGTSELMCHPAIHDDALENAHTRLKRERERELEALTDPGLRRFAEQHGIELINFRGL
ncbi:MAG: ChbG/HpnK family deacetylase [Blastocatellia bacterium]